MSSGPHKGISPWVLVRSVPIWGWPLLLPWVLLGAVGWVVQLPFDWMKPRLRRAFRPLKQTKLYRKLHPWFTISLWRASASEPLDPYRALGQMRIVRAILIPTLVLEWMCLVTMGAGGALLLLGCPGRQVGWGILAMGPLVILSVPAMLLNFWCVRTYRRWRDLSQMLCDQCGYNRDHIESSRCPECGTMRSPVSSGQLPEEWAHWEWVVAGDLSYVPYGFLGTIGMGTIFISSYLPHLPLGVFLLLMTISLTVVAAWLLIHTWQSAHDASARSE